MEESQARIEECIQANPPEARRHDPGLGLIAEWQTEDGEKKLTRLVSGEASKWQVSGYLHEALFGLEETWSDRVRRQDA